MNQIDDVLVRLDGLRRKGMYGFCIISYEFGYFMESKLRPSIPSNINFPIIQYYFFNEHNVMKFNCDELDFSNVGKLLKSDEREVSDFKLNKDLHKYYSDIKKIKNYIADGDTYQVNYTVKGKFNFAGNAAVLFLRLIFNQTTEYSAFINTNDNLILSISPELFFRKRNSSIVTSPMKGTINRGINCEIDLLHRNRLKDSEKDKAENLMIVDLLRNDLGKISEIGSVRVNSLFNIEKYETVFQMTSDIESDLVHDDLSYVVRNIFPSGSITGAPKIRTMEIISELEKESRNIYTGSIGLITPSEEIFNVSIRTILIDNKRKTGEIGLGSGIVWDSEPENEYNETILKSKFMTEPDEYYELFETMLYENGEFFLLQEHLNRLKVSADYFLFYFDEYAIKNELKNYAKLFDYSDKYRVKLSLNKWGEFVISHELYYPDSNHVKIVISPDKINPFNKFQYFKTTNRKKYDYDYSIYTSLGFFDVIYFNIQNELMEGTKTNIFLRKGNEYFTPQISCGILNGCYRNYLLNHYNNFYEKILYLSDILDADEVLLTNSLRKKIKVSGVWLGEERIK